MRKHPLLLAGCAVSLWWASVCPALAQATPADSLMNLFRQVAGYEQRWTREQVYLHLDNNAYIEGETIWFNAYVVYASTLRPTHLSRVLYVELLNAAGDVMSRQKLRIADNGQADGSFKLDEQTMKSGYYEIRAYTRAMLNWDAASVYSRVVPVFRRPEGGAPDGQLVMAEAYGHTDAPSLRSKKPADAGERRKRAQDGLDLTFYPEGGFRVAGLPSDVAFRLTDANGNPVEGTLRLVGKAGEELATARTEHEGMGSLAVPPTAEGASVVAEAGTATARFALPASHPGYALSATWTSADTLRLTVGGGTGAVARLLGVSATTRGHATYFDTLSIAPGVVRGLNVPRTSLGSGVNQLTLVDASGRVWAERLVWNDPPAALHLDVRQSQASYSPCSPVALEMRLTDAAGRPRQASFSLAVRDRGGELVAPGAGIRESLLLSSGVKGYIARPEYYFAADDAPRRRALDLLLLVQGWRCYDWREMAGLTGKRLEQPVEEGILIDGRAVGGRVSKSLDNCDVDIDIFLADQRLKGEARTDSAGEFAFLCPSFYGDAIGTFYLSRGGKARFGYVALNRNFIPEPRFISEAERRLRPPVVPSDPALLHAPLFAWTDTLPKASIVLGEAKVNAKGFDNYFTGRYSWEGGEAAGRRYADIYYNVEDEIERYMDEGHASPGLWEWLRGRNKYFYYEILDDGGPADEQRRELAETGHPGLPKFKVEYKGRPTYVVLDNELLGAEGPGFLEKTNPSELTADEVKTLIISEDPQAYQRYVQPKTGVALSQAGAPVTIFVYSNPSTDIYQYKKGRRITRIHGYTAPQDYYHPDYRTRDVPTDTDYRRTLYWNPNVATDADGRASAVFFSNSRPGARLVFSAQGVTPAGEFVDMEK